MPEINRNSSLEQRYRVLMVVNVLLLILLLGDMVFGHRSWTTVKAQEHEGPKALTVSELSVIDAKGIVRARIGGNLPDAVFGGRTHPRGDSAAGILLYDNTGQERSGYVTFGSGNVGLTLDNRTGQTAEFLAGPGAGSVMRLHWHDDAVELRADQDGPSVHVVRDKHVVFHEPAVEHPESTELCKALREMRPQQSKEALMGACRARSTEVACHACLAN